jgi:hypothetical protein
MDVVCKRLGVRTDILPGLLAGASTPQADVVSARLVDGVLLCLTMTFYSYSVVVKKPKTTIGLLAH